VARSPLPGSLSLFSCPLPPSGSDLHLSLSPFPFFSRYVDDGDALNLPRPVFRAVAAIYLSLVLRFFSAPHWCYYELQPLGEFKTVDQMYFRRLLTQDYPELIRRLYRAGDCLVFEIFFSQMRLSIFLWLSRCSLSELPVWRAL